jgi:hypothetical protein
MWVGNEALPATSPTPPPDMLIYCCYPVSMSVSVRLASLTRPICQYLKE